MRVMEEFAKMRERKKEFVKDGLGRTGFHICMNGEIPRTNMVKLGIEGGGSIIIRLSGTEPKMKVYVSVSAERGDKAIKREKIMVKVFKGVAGI